MIIVLTMCFRSSNVLLLSFSLKFCQAISIMGLRYRVAYCTVPGFLTFYIMMIMWTTKFYGACMNEMSGVKERNDQFWNSGMRMFSLCPQLRIQKCSAEILPSWPLRCHRRGVSGQLDCFLTYCSADLSDVSSSG
jgi:hypothetical protein